jgi:signal transduction histidine kinase
VVPSSLITALTLVPVLLAVAVGVLSVKGAQLTWWPRLRLALGIVLVASGQTVWNSTLPPTASLVVSLVATAAGALLLCYAALDMVRTSIRSYRRELASLYARLISVESTVRENRARLHEVASTVAGITSVSRLIREPAVVIPRQRRSLLEHTMAAELSRLERLMAGDTDELTEFAVDDVLRQLVVAQQAQGRSVTWEPSGHRVCGRPDDLAEAVHVLLDNAALHGDGQGATIEVREREHVVEILVSNHGPGIAPDVRAHVFEWGARGQGSRGQGIGLHIARDLVEQQGGYLLLDDSPQPGTTFIVGVLVGERNDAAGHRAV